MMKKLENKSGNLKEILIAIADGKEVQYFMESHSNWWTMNPHNVEFVFTSEAYGYKWRIKPDEPVGLFDVADSNQKYNLINNCLGVESLTYHKDSFDKEFIELGNHFTDKVEAERMAGFFRKNFLYWRMALKFADGYEFKSSEDNYYVYKYGSSIDIGYSDNCNVLGSIHMTKENAKAFAEFCNKHKQELGL